MKWKLGLIAIAVGIATAAAATVRARSVALPQDRDEFTVRTELQSMYDEISQAWLQVTEACELDAVHEVTNTMDWVFVDTKGARQTWPQVREGLLQGLTAA